MKFVPPYCPNNECVNRTAPPANFYVKAGYYRTRHNNQLVPRYRCKAEDCGRYFSPNAFKDTRGQHRPDINRRLFVMLVSGVSQRRAAIAVGSTKRTVDRRLKELGDRAKAMHLEALHSETMKTTCVQLDELATFEHARAKPLTVAVAVRTKNGQILGVRVGRVPTSGKLAELGREHYRWTLDERVATVTALLTDIAPTVAPNATFITDKAAVYRNLILRAFPAAKVETHKSLAGVWKRGAPKEHDPMFRLNNTFAKLRNDLGRLARKTWVTTKSRLALERHLWLYVAWVNGYPVTGSLPGLTRTRMNRKMARALNINAATEMPLDSRLQQLLAKGFGRIDSTDRSKDGCLYLKSMRTRTAMLKCDGHATKTLREATVNCIHIDEYVGERQLEAAYAFMLHLFSVWRRQQHVKHSTVRNAILRVIVLGSASGTELHFHQVRTGERYHAANLDTYSECILVANSATGSSGPS